MKKLTAFLFTMIMPGSLVAAAVDLSEPKTIIADKIEYDLKSETMRARGKTEIVNKSGERVTLPDEYRAKNSKELSSIEYDLKSESIRTHGKTEIVNKSGQRMTLTDSYMSKNGDALTGDDIKIWLGSHIYAESDDVVREGDITIARNAEFTACDGCDAYGNAWTITATKLRHNMATRMLSFYNPVFWTYDLPVFWLPYFSIPDPGVKHKSGLLMPDFESTNKMGTQINLPIYAYLSETHDLTLTLSYLTQENPLFRVEHRLNGEHSQYRTKGSFTHNQEGENRWHIFNDDVIELGEYARATIFLARASDKTYLQKYGFYNAQPYLDSGAKLEVFGQSSYIVADVHKFQELRKYSSTRAVPSGDILPNIRAVHQTAPIYKETFLTFSSDVLGISGSGTASQRVIGDARVTSPWTLPLGNRVTASIATRYDLYHFENTKMVDGDKFTGLKNRFLPSGYLEWGLPLMRPRKTWSQIIEPRARLTVMRHTDQDQFALNNDSSGAFLSDTTLFSDNRFSGLDLWENGTFADYGVRWAAFNNKNGKTAEVFFGQTYDFTDRAATDPNSGFHNGASDYVGRIGYNNQKWFNINSRFRVAKDDLSLRHAETSGRIGSGANYINVGHIWSQRFIDERTRADDINQSVIGVGIKLSDRWSTAWNATYNITYSAFQSHNGALYYNHPCYYLSLGYRRDNAIKGDYVGTTTFQFRFGISIDGQQY